MHPSTPRSLVRQRPRHPNCQVCRVAAHMDPASAAPPGMRGARAKFLSHLLSKSPFPSSGLATAGKQGQESTALGHPMP